ncbi:MAG: nickel-dependent lactate racemase [Promethearchaeati archaeon]
MSDLKKIVLDYGKDGLEVPLDPDWDVDIIKPIHQEPIEEPIKALQSAIRNPINSNSLEKIVQNKGEINRVCIVVSDATRPVPSHLILDALIKELNEYGVKDERINILIATGLHRKTRNEEKERIIGEELLGRVNIIDHIATDDSLFSDLGKTSDSDPILINKFYINSDLKIITGYVEPHFFFGFSGGRKSIVPGISGEGTILSNHSAKNIHSQYARFGVYEENPMHKLAMEIVKKVGVDFMVNVCINEHHKIIKIATGDYIKAHENLVEYQKNKVFEEIDSPYDIVICGNGGYPLDLNLYQAVKSMAIGEMAVKQGGTIISVNELSDGIGISQDNFKNLIFSGMNPEEIYEKILKREIDVPDLWEIMVLVRVLMKADIFVISSLKREDLGNIGLRYASNVRSAIQSSLEKYGKDAKILILPNGPQILPKLRA